MAANDFVAFYSSYLTKHPDLRKTLEGISDPMEFIQIAIAEGKKAGFEFDVADAAEVLVTSYQDHAKQVGTPQRLSEEQLETVVGGIIAPTSMVDISSLSVTQSLNSNPLYVDKLMASW